MKWSQHLVQQRSISFSVKQSISIHICSKTIQQCGHGSTRTVSCAVHFEMIPVPIWWTILRDFMLNWVNHDDECCTISHSLTICTSRRLMSCFHLRQMVACSLLLCWLNRFVGACDVDLNAFELSQLRRRRWNRFQNEDSMRMKILFRTFVHYCGHSYNVSHSFIDSWCQLIVAKFYFIAHSEIIVEGWMEHLQHRLPALSRDDAWCQ